MTWVMKMAVSDIDILSIQKRYVTVSEGFDITLFPVTIATNCRGCINISYVVGHE
jgi:hypothetical protein